MNAQDEKQISINLSVFKNLLGMLGAAAARNGGELRIPQAELVDYNRFDPVFYDPATMEYVLRIPAPKRDSRLVGGQPADLVVDEFALSPADNWQLGHEGEGSAGPFRTIRHSSGFAVTYFVTAHVVVCHRPEPCPEWHRSVMAALKADDPWTVTATADGNICHDILGFLAWVESFASAAEPAADACPRWCSLNPLLQEDLEVLWSRHQGLGKDGFRNLPQVVDLMASFNDWLADQ